MGKIILVRKDQLSFLVNESLKSKNKRLLKEWGYNYGQKGQQCFSWERYKDGTIRSGNILPCELLDEKGFIKKEVGEKWRRTGAMRAGGLGLQLMWNARFEYPENYANMDISKRTTKDMLEWLAPYKSGQDLLLLQQRSAQIIAGPYHYRVPFSPTFGEALANYLMVEKTKTFYDMFKEHFNKLGVGISLGKGPSGLPEVKIDYNAGSSAKNEKGGTTNFCPKGQNKCTGTYTKCCDSPKIAEAQKCLGLQGVGKWGPKTQKAIEQKFPQFAKSFTDADVATICGKK